MELVAVTDLKEHKIFINVENLNRRKSSRIPSKFDPRPFNMRTVNNAKAIDTLRADLLNVGHACTFTSILVPSVEKALQDHTYHKTLPNDSASCFVTDSTSQQSSPTSQQSLPTSPSPPQQELPEQYKAVKEGLQVCEK